jgi:hypothetical protein
MAASKADKRVYFSKEALAFMRNELLSMGETARNTKGRAIGVMTLTKRRFPETRAISDSSFFRWLRALRVELSSNNATQSTVVSSAKPVTKDGGQLYADVISMAVNVLLSNGEVDRLKTIAELVVAEASGSI